MSAQDILYLETDKKPDFFENWLLAQGYIKDVDPNFPNNPSYIIEGIAVSVEKLKVIKVRVPDNVQKSFGFRPAIDITIDISHRNNYAPGLDNSRKTIGKILREIGCNTLWVDGHRTIYGIYKNRKLLLQKNEFSDKTLDHIGLPAEFVQFPKDW